MSEPPATDWAIAGRRMPAPVPAASPGGDADDLALVRRAASGDRLALRSLYERHASRVMTVALRVLRLASEAEDVVQETFFEVWRRAPEFDPARGSPQAWILTICRTRAIDRLRSRAAGSRVLNQQEIDPQVVRSPAESAEQGQARERIDVALAQLPAEQRQVLELAYFEGLSQSEIASRTGEPLGTVKTRVRLGMEKLAGLLAELAAASIVGSGGRS
jgi:RNA polymerase sigma-70 factor, ECF subfamily